MKINCSGNSALREERLEMNGYGVAAKANQRDKLERLCRSSPARPSASLKPGIGGKTGKKGRIFTVVRRDLEEIPG